MKKKINHEKYVPILRWKRAEKNALKDVADKECSLVEKRKITRNMIPLIEFIMQPKVKETLQESRLKFSSDLPKRLEEIAGFWGKRSLFLDVQLIYYEDREKALEQILKFSKERNLSFIPVLNLMPDSDQSKLKSIVLKYAEDTGKGFCLRMIASGFSNSMGETIKRFLKNKASVEKIDLLIDFKTIDGTDYRQIENQIKEIPYLNKWRSFIVASGAFPKDLSGFEKYNDYDIPRFDYMLWEHLAKKLERKPLFSDYTIQCPVYKEPPAFSNPSASVRYATEEKWIIKRGEGLKNLKGKGFRQYPAHARLLVDSPYFKGRDFSAGDKYVADIAEGAKKDFKKAKTGNVEKWLQAGINHHMTLTAMQTGNDL